MKKEIKDFKKENAGRSMTEMLGVLAIIGVLSIGGVVGYKLAMNRYAANQIAYEMNMMKTDAKVKIMQGNDTLTLGQPYDGDSDYLGHLNYNETYTVDFDCALAGDKFIDEDVSCQVANAYYIEVQNIPEGICKPLANLIKNMNELISFEVTKSDDENSNGENCYEGNNDLFAAFSAEPDAKFVACESEEDNECPEKASHCDVNRHMCVECLNDNDCTNKSTRPYCDKEAKQCTVCPDGGAYDERYGTCVVQVPTQFFARGAWAGNPDSGNKCTRITPQGFGPYEHSYKIYGHGTIDDYLRLYVNTVPDVSDPLNCTTGFRAEKFCCGYWCSERCPDFELGELKAGEYGNLVVWDLGAWSSWGLSWVEADSNGEPRNDGAIWLVLEDE